MAESFFQQMHNILCNISYRENTLFLPLVDKNKK